MGLGKMIIAPLRFADYSNTFRYDGQWFEKISNNVIGIIGAELPVRHITVDPEINVGFRLVDLSPEQMVRIEKFYGPNFYG
jgi:hypothetical protein